MDGTGYAVRDIDGKRYIHYNYKGYCSSFEITKYIEEITYKVDDYMDGELLGVVDAKRWIITDEKAVHTLIDEDIKKEIATDEYRHWCIKTRYPGAEGTKDSFTCDDGKVLFCDEIPEKYINITQDKDTGEDVMEVTKPCFTCPDGKIAIMEDL